MEAAADSEIDKRERWERQPRETNAAWAAFQVYRDIPPADRTLRDAYRAVKGPDKGSVCGTWRGWFVKYAWKERAEAYDVYVDEKARLELEQRRAEARKETAELGKMLRDKAQEALRAFKGVNEKIEEEKGEQVRTIEPNLTAYQIARLSTVGVSLERLALGEPQSISDITSGGAKVTFFIPKNDRDDRGEDE
jgi:hypothetical protein